MNKVYDRLIDHGCRNKHRINCRVTSFKLMNALKFFFLPLSLLDYL